MQEPLKRPSPESPEALGLFEAIEQQPDPLVRWAAHLKAICGLPADSRHASGMIQAAKELQEKAIQAQ